MNTVPNNYERPLRRGRHGASIQSGALKELTKLEGPDRRSIEAWWHNDIYGCYPTKSNPKNTIKEN